MDAVRPMAIIVRNAMMQTVGSSHSMLLTFFIIRVPTRTMAPTVQAPVNVENIPENRKNSRYGANEYESEKPVDAETMARIKGTIDSCGLLAWTGIPERDYKSLSKKTMDFVFDDGETVTAEDNRVLPYGIGNGFFNIELEMATKHRRLSGMKPEDLMKWFIFS